MVSKFPKTTGTINVAPNLISPLPCVHRCTAHTCRTKKSTFPCVVELPRTTPGICLRPRQSPGTRLLWRAFRFPLHLHTLVPGASCVVHGLSYVIRQSVIISVLPRRFTRNAKHRTIRTTYAPQSIARGQSSCRLR